MKVNLTVGNTVYLKFWRQIFNRQNLPTNDSKDLEEENFFFN